MGKILVIDDNRAVCESMVSLIRRIGHDTATAYSLEDGFEQAVADTFDVVLLDVNLPDGNGLDLLPKLKKIISPPEVIIITGAGDPDGAELAIRTGAWDYIEKTASAQKMMLSLIRAMLFREEKATRKPTVALKKHGMVGNSAPMNACLDFLAQAAGIDANVLVTGETGTGKELFSRAIHENSDRSAMRFVVVDCAALPATLVESVLFGHVKGAFTGADKAQEGLIKHADRGTLFLDEVGELSLSVQKAFLRVLQERSFRPVGGKVEFRSDFRLIAATNRNLDRLVRDGGFREDMLFRLKTLTLNLPPLRERPEDIKDIAAHYITRLCEHHGMETKGVSSEFFEMLHAYTWPGNVREMINALEKAIVTGKNDHKLLPVHLPTEIRAHSARSAVGIKKSPAGDADTTGLSVKALLTYKELREKTEKKYLQNLIANANGDIKTACSISDLSRSHLYSLLKKYNIGKSFITHS
jgi:two-component system, NtrC family, response regulator